MEQPSRAPEPIKQATSSKNFKQLYFKSTVL